MSAYDLVRFKLTWGGASVSAFGLLVVFLGTVVVVARANGTFHFWSVVVVLVVPALSLVGLGLGVMGLRRSKRRISAAVGTTLNSAVFLSTLIAVVLSRLGV